MKYINNFFNEKTPSERKKDIRKCFKGKKPMDR